MGRKNSKKQTPQHGRGKARRQGFHKHKDSPETHKAAAWLHERRDDKAA